MDSKHTSRSKKFTKWILLDVDLSLCENIYPTSYHQMNETLKAELQDPSFSELGPQCTTVCNYRLQGRLLCQTLPEEVGQPQSNTDNKTHRSWLG